MSKKPKRATTTRDTPPSAKRARTDSPSQSETFPEGVTTAADLLNVLNNLGENEFKDFKWHLQQGRSAIPKGQLEKAERRDTVDKMVQTYTLSKAVEVTKKVLKKIKRNDLVQSLSDSSSAPAGDDSGDESSSLTAAPLPPTNTQTDDEASPFSGVDLSSTPPTNSRLKLFADDLDDPGWKLGSLRMDHGGVQRLESGLRKHACELKMDSNLVQKMSFNKKETSVNQSHPDRPGTFGRLLRKFF